MEMISKICGLLWGDIIKMNLSNDITIGISLLVLILIPSGLYFTIRTRFLPIRFFKEMIKISVEKQENEDGAISGIQSLIVSTATRVGMGNLVGVVAAISAGGPGAVFWMWVTALIGSSTAFIEGTLAQIYKEKDSLYGGYKGGPAYYIHNFFSKGKKYNLLAIAFALSGLLCWCGVSQVIGNSITSAFDNAFDIPPIITITLVVLASAIIVFKKNATVKVLDIMVPIMAALYFVITIIVIVMNINILPDVLKNIFLEAFGIRQVAAGGIGAALMNGVKRGLFSNEAGSGSAPCASAASDVSHPVKAGLFQAFGVMIDTIVICTCTAMVMLLAPSHIVAGKEGMDLLQSAMGYYFGDIGIYFIALILLLFSFSTFIGILFYARSNISYLFKDSWKAQNIYKIIALVMLFIGGIASYEFVWELGDIGVGLMTIFNMITIIPMSSIAIKSLNDYRENHMNK